MTAYLALKQDGTASPLSWVWLFLELLYRQATGVQSRFVEMPLIVE